MSGVKGLTLTCLLLLFIHSTESYRNMDKVIDFRQLVNENEIHFIDREESDPIINPGYQVPSFSAPTLNGTYSFTPMPPNQQTPAVVFALNSESVFQSVMWSSLDSLISFFINSPTTTDYLFLSQSPQYTEEVKYMNSQMQSTMQLLNFSQSQIDQWNSHLYFLNEQLFNIQPLYEILHQFPTKVQRANIYFPFGPKNIKRLDGSWPWDQGMTAFYNRSVQFPIVSLGDGCSSQSPKGDLDGMIALISSEGNCTINAKVIAAEVRGAAGVVFYTQQYEDFFLLDCGIPCDIYPDIPSTLIAYSDAQEILSYLPDYDILISFEDEVSIGSYFVIGSDSEVEEIGNLMNPSMKFLAWIAEYYQYIQNTVDDVTTAQAVTGAYSIPVLQSAHMDGPFNVTLSLPFTTDQLRSFSSIQLETYLDCDGSRDRSCPIWDRTLQFFVCCGELESNLCWQELGRWITPFHRRVGYWITPITPLLPLFLTNSECTFSIAINSQGGGVDDPWVPSLNLLFQSPNQSSIAPFHILPLFGGGTFNQTYNSKYSPIVFNIPPNTLKVELYAVITGHGSDNNGCCEFCVTTHNFAFNNATSPVSRTFYNAGTPEGCAHRVGRGGVPNEYGTWLYGRDGWCDGNTVEPWVTDVSSLLDLRTGASNSVLYSGLYQGQTPDPEYSPGYIIMYSYLSFYSSV